MSELGCFFSILIMFGFVRSIGVEFYGCISKSYKIFNLFVYLFYIWIDKKIDWFINCLDNLKIVW